MYLFLGTGVAAVGVIVWLLVSPPTPSQLEIAARRSGPTGSVTHDVVELAPAPAPTPPPGFEPPCDSVAGVFIHGGEAAQNRLGFVLESYLCPIATDERKAPEVKQAIAALKDATIRFGLFRRTGEQSTADINTRTIYVNVDLARTSVDPIVIGPLIAHEAWHLFAGASGPVTAAQEFGARRAELQACRAIYSSPDREPSRGCLDAQAIVALGEARAVELLARSGFPR
jgi:hypothetical protein